MRREKSAWKENKFSKVRVAGTKAVYVLLCCAMVIALNAVKVYASNTSDGTLTVENEDISELLNPELIYRELVISTREDFLTFAENCRLDSYSYNLQVVLENDIDLKGDSFEGVPIFAGTFDGQGHSIIGLQVDGEGSVKGLFRYLTETAVVQNVNVEGDVVPSGTRCDVGGIAGNNAGKILNCSFSGMVSGADNVGGIVGINEVSGIVEKCHTEGTITGKHFLGGIAGNNFGVIRRSINSAMMNTTVEQNEVGISDITIESLTGAESVTTVTDIGGIVGGSSGVLKNCINYSQVGYRQIGYNVGGIAGSQVGYIVDCVNYGDVYGRKEVGGIVGHQEPNVLMVYELDTLQTLEGQLDTMQNLTDRATANAQSGTNQLNSQLKVMNTHAKDAQESVNKMQQMYDSGEYDEDSMIAYQNNLSDSLKGMASSMEKMSNITRNTTSTLNKNIQAITNQMDAINNTLNHAEDGFGGEIKDVSDADTEELTSSEVYSCDNYGRIDGELNVGGIVGLIAIETDLDSTEDVDFVGDISMNFISEMRSVVLANKNWGIVTVKKQFGGGIVGRQDLGLIRECTNVGMVEGESADFVGGIVGQSLGYIRFCNAKCVLKGQNNVGGIAGSGMIASDCLSMVEIKSGTEMLGAVFGLAEEDRKGEDAPITDNYYVVTGIDIGGIDGISYAGCAEPMEWEAFLALENLPDVFKVATVQFWADGVEVDAVTLRIGEELSLEQIPQVPDKTGMFSVWEGLDEIDLTEIKFDLRFDALYLENDVTLQSHETAEDGKPLVLLLGEFTPNGDVAISELENVAIAQSKGEVVKAWEYKVDGAGEVSEVRFLTPSYLPEKEIRLWLRDSLGVWRMGSYRIEGSYMVFEVNAEDDAFALVEVSGVFSQSLWILAGAAMVFVFMVVFIGIRIRKTVKNKNKNKITES